MPPAACRLQAQLAELERFFRYCSGLRERRPLPQRHYFHSVMGITGKAGWQLTIRPASQPANPDLGSRTLCWHIGRPAAPPPPPPRLLLPCPCLPLCR